MSSLEVRGVLLPLNRGQLLLPNSTVNEVVGYLQPAPIPGNSNDWLLGLFDWRQQQVPVIIFERLLGEALPEIGHRARIAICNTLNGNKKCPYVGILLQSIPHLVRVDEQNIAPMSAEQGGNELVKAEVMVNGSEAWIPDLDLIEAQVISSLPEQDWNVSAANINLD